MSRSSVPLTKYQLLILYVLIAILILGYPITKTSKSRTSHKLTVYIYTHIHHSYGLVPCIRFAMFTAAYSISSGMLILIIFLFLMWYLKCTNWINLKLCFYVFVTSTSAINFKICIVELCDITIKEWSAEKSSPKSGTHTYLIKL